MADKPHLHVEFFMDAVENPRRSREEGRPIFEDKEFVRIRIVGDPKNTIVSEAHEPKGRDRDTGEIVTYATRFPEHYRLFKAGEGQKLDGTPLTEVPWLTAGRREELKHFNVLTVEGLAQLDGSALQRLGLNARELKNKAIAWLDAAAGSAGDSRLAAELAARDAEIETLKGQMAELLARGKPTEPTFERYKGYDTLNAEPGVTAEAAPEPEVDGSSPFEAWDDADIKNWIADNSGQRPPGNPSHKTLVAKADEINVKLAEKQAA